MLSKRELLHDCEWHDLVVDEITVAADHFAVAVSPYDEATQAYRHLRLTVSKLERLDIAMTGTVGDRDLAALEVSSLDIREERDDRLAGRLSILAGAAGLWTLDFAGATWQLAELAANGMTQGRRRLIEYLLRRTATDDSETNRRWQRASDMARRYAVAGELLLARDWTADLILDQAGDVWVVDTESGGQPRGAAEPERRSALFRGLQVYPEILPLLPPRPASAAKCESCDGAGIPQIVFENQALQNLLCVCAGAGWTVGSPYA